MTAICGVATPTQAEFAARRPRPSIVGQDEGPTPPFPLRLQGKVERGFGRGSKELGCPTANLPDVLTKHHGLERNGIYFGWASVEPKPGEPALVKEMVMSAGYNPVYGNQFRTIEVHILHDFGRDFYGEELRIVVLGYIRPEYQYTSKDELIKDIEIDKAVALRSLARPGYQIFSRDDSLTT